MRGYNNVTVGGYNNVTVGGGGYNNVTVFLRVHSLTVRP